MKKALDTLSSLLARAGDVLFVQNPRGTSLGVFTGFCMDGATKLFGPALSHFLTLIDLNQVSTLFWVSIGIVGFNIPLLFRRRQLPPSVEDSFEAIRRLRREGVSEAQLRVQLIALLNSVVARVDFDENQLSSGPSLRRKRATPLEKAVEPHRRPR